MALSPGPDLGSEECSRVGARGHTVTWACLKIGTPNLMICPHSPRFSLVHFGGALFSRQKPCRQQDALKQAQQVAAKKKDYLDWVAIQTLMFSLFGIRFNQMVYHSPQKRLDYVRLLAGEAQTTKSLPTCRLRFLYVQTSIGKIELKRIDEFLQLKRNTGQLSKP